jgi:hypothetical protein
MGGTIVVKRNTRSERDLRFSWVRLATAVSLLPALLLGSRPMLAQQPSQQVFHSPEEASRALFTAAQQTDNRVLLGILGPAGNDVIESGDRAEDMKRRASFVAKYEEMHRLAKEPDSTMVIYVGAENWPLPIPLVEKSGVWYFDTDAGKQEILARRVGKNEMAAIDACYQLVRAEDQHYASADYGEHQYALRFISESGRHDGLFWSEAGDPFASPLHPLIASAGVENATAAVDAAASQQPVPFNGYYFRILTAQGNNAEGGAKSYIVDGKMVGGFAFVAYPAAYRSSGVMTFIVSQNGVLYQNDLGPDTEKIATTMTEYNPDSTWQRVH